MHLFIIIDLFILLLLNKKIIYLFFIIFLKKRLKIEFDWGLVIGDWGLGPIPIPNPQSPITNPHNIFKKI